MILFVCLLFTAAAFVYVFHVPEQVVAGPENTRASFLRERKDAVYENLRDLNFEYKAGKLADTDYQTLRSGLEDEAATIMAELSQVESAETNELSRKRGK